MIESIWENNIQKTIGKQQIQQPIINFSESFSSTLTKEDSKKPFHQPEKNEFGPNLSHNQLKDTDIEHIFKQINQFEKPKVLFLKNNHISDIGLKKILHSLQQNKTIQHLILSNNNICISEFCKAAIMDLLKVNHYIGWLVLNGNNINDEGAINLANSLKENKSVIHLILSENKITDKGLKVLLKNIENHPKLESLFLNNNQLTEKSLIDLEKFIYNSPKIKRIYIENIQTKQLNQLTPLKTLCKKRNIHLVY